MVTNSFQKILATSCTKVQTCSMKKFNLYKETLAMIERSELSVTQIAALADEDFGWLYKVIGGTIANPGVHRIQAIYDVLSKIEERSSKVA